MPATHPSSVSLSPSRKSAVKEPKARKHHQQQPRAKASSSSSDRREKRSATPSAAQELTAADFPLLVPPQPSSRTASSKVDRELGLLPLPSQPVPVARSAKSATKQPKTRRTSMPTSKGTATVASSAPAASMLPMPTLLSSPATATASASASSSSFSSGASSPSLLSSALKSPSTPPRTLSPRNSEPLLMSPQHFRTSPNRPAQFAPAPAPPMAPLSSSPQSELNGAGLLSVLMIAGDSAAATAAAAKHERWAGGAFQNSPDPSALPLPAFDAIPERSAPSSASLSTPSLPIFASAPTSAAPTASAPPRVSSSPPHQIMAVGSYPSNSNTVVYAHAPAYHAPAPPQHHPSFYYPTAPAPPPLQSAAPMYLSQPPTGNTSQMSDGLRRMLNISSVSAF